MKAAVMFACVWFIVSCGGTSTDDGYSDGSPKPSTVSWDQASAIIQKACAKCHDGVREPAFTSGAIFKASKSAFELQSGGMPKAPGIISADEKTALLSYLKG